MLYVEFAAFCLPQNALIAEEKLKERNPVLIQSRVGKNEGTWMPICFHFFVLFIKLLIFSSLSLYFFSVLNVDIASSHIRFSFS